jgi:hypothetical protein
MNRCFLFLLASPPLLIAFGVAIGTAQSVATPQQCAAFEIRQVNQDPTSSQTFTWEDVPNHGPVSIKLSSKPFMDTSILREAKMAPVLKGPYAGCWDIEILFNANGATAFDALWHQRSDIAYVLCGIVVAVHGNFQAQTEHNTWQSFRLNTFLPKAKAEKYIAAINAEIARRGHAPAEDVTATSPN